MDCFDITEELAEMSAKSSEEDADAWLPFWIHSIDTAGVLAYLIDGHLAPSALKCIGKEAKKLILFTGIVQDIGMLTEVFQNRMSNRITEHRQRLEERGFPVSTSFPYAEKSPHNVAGESILLSLGCPESVAAVIGAHHGFSVRTRKDAEENIRVYRENYGGTKWERLWKEWLDISLEYAGFCSVRDIPVLNMSQQYILTSVIILGDWLASNTNYFPLITNEKMVTDYGTRLEEGLKAMALPDTWQPVKKQIEQVFPERFRMSDSMRLFDAGLVIMESPEGKDGIKDAVMLAEQLAVNYGCRGIFYGTYTKEGMETVSPILEGIVEQCFHGRLAITGDCGKDIYPVYTREKCELLPDFVLSTVSHALMSVQKRNHAMLKMLGLVGKTVILDGAGLYDAGMNEYVTRFLEWMGRYDIPVILRSSILPDAVRNTYIRSYIRGKNRKSSESLSFPETGYPCLTYTKGTDVYTVSCPAGYIEKNMMNISNIEEVVMGQERRTAIAVKDYNEALAVFQEIQKKMPERECVLAHRFFMEIDGIEQRQKAQNLPKSGVLVCTADILSAMEWNGCVLIAGKIPFPYLAHLSITADNISRIAETPSQNAISITAGDIRREWDKWYLENGEKTGNTKAFMIPSPSESKYPAINTFRGFMDTAVQDNARTSVASIDRKESGLRIVPFLKKEDGQIFVLGHPEISIKKLSDKKQRHLLNRYSIPLPYIYLAKYEQCVSELSDMAHAFPNWKNKGIFPVFVDGTGNGMIAGIPFRYNTTVGMLTENLLSTGF